MPETLQFDDAQFTGQSGTAATLDVGVPSPQSIVTKGFRPWQLFPGQVV